MKIEFTDEFVETEAESTARSNKDWADINAENRAQRLRELRGEVDKARTKLEWAITHLREQIARNEFHDEASKPPAEAPTAEHAPIPPASDLSPK